MHRFLRICLVWLLLSVSAAASEADIAAQIIDKTLASLFAQPQVKAWGDTPAELEIIKHSRRMVAVENPDEAEFLLLEKAAPSGPGVYGVLFGTDFALFEADERVIGAFYWQKGRPNLIFLRDRLEAQGLQLSEEFDKYVEEGLER